MKDETIHDRIARRVRDLRAARGISLEALATQCGVSRSMLSLIERGESSPTAVVLEKLSGGLGVPLASLFDPPEPAASPVLRAADQVAWRDPHSGYVRRNVSPVAPGNPAQIVDVSFPPHARVTYESGPRPSLVHQYVWMLEGTMEITHGDDVHTLHAGDCLAMGLDRPNSFHNPADTPARYAVVLTTDH
ncbi:helix-turn-helix domain-containing protein [Duganella sp. FT92W]|uniref:Helix-turn-helix domain-containing protein n=1 Tax=Pseudoduganella rivuli TaxID=2666085 RepID=A0A7X2IU94_9BURK|nr:XRE family transcriptional regulator [Pseudoduganella rivuli]MRV76226.1 helix-turn-helix domain-containing protein [Pseudoduganella rivuli]